MKFFLYLFLIFSVMACSKPVIQEKQKETVVKTVYLEKPDKIIPKLNPVKMNPVSWDVLTVSNKEDKFKENAVYYGLTAEEYEKMALNLNNLRAYIESQKSIIDNYNK